MSMAQHMARPATRFTGPNQPDTACVIITMDRQGTAPLLRSIANAGLTPPLVQTWGSHAAYEQLLARPRSLAIVDVPNPRWLPTLHQRIGLLTRLSPVVPLVPSGADAAALLDLGATNVLDRNMSVRELAARLAAEQRWLISTAARPSPCSPFSAKAQSSSSRPIHRSQRLLLCLLIQHRQPWCCHDLSWLLGTPEQPLRRPALRARLARLKPHLARLGLELSTAGDWGRTRYEVRPHTLHIADPSSAGLPPRASLNFFGTRQAGAHQDGRCGRMSA